jgi:hypothetical protein
MRRWDYDSLIDCFRGRDSSVVDDFVEVAHGLIADGADIIIAGCAYVGPLLTTRGIVQVPGTGVPIIDCTAASIQMAVLMARLRSVAASLGPSRAPHSPYCPPRAGAEVPFAVHPEG